MTYRLGAVLTHPIQYYSPWLRALAQRVDLKVYYAFQQTPEGQARAGFGEAFEWDLPLLDGYDWQWLQNVAAKPGIDQFGGCDTPQISGIVRREKFDALLLFGWNRKCFWQAAWGAKRAGTPVAVRVDSQLSTTRALWRRIAKSAPYRLILPWAANYMSPGSRTDAYLRHYGVGENRIHRVPHVIDTQRFRVAAAEAKRTGATSRLRADNGASDENFVLLSVGKLAPHKRVDLIIEAFARFRAKSPERGARARLWIVGDGPSRTDLEALASNQNGHVRFLGFANQSAMPQIYAAADCLVSASQETWGLVVNEAFACDLPVIVSHEAGCSPELVREDVTGWTLGQIDADALSALFARACDKARGLDRGLIRALTDQGGFDAGVDAVLGMVDRLRRP